MYAEPVWTYKPNTNAVFTPRISDDVNVPPHFQSNMHYLYVWDQIFKKNKDSIIQVIGQRGDCKSGYALRFGLDFDVEKNDSGDWVTRFNLDHVLFTARDVVSAYRADLPKGTVIVWDEAGVEMTSADSYLSVKNKLLKVLFETNRYKNYVLLLTAPNALSISKSSRRIVSSVVEMNGRISEHFASGKFKISQVNSMTGDIFPKIPRAYSLSKEKVASKTFFTQRPPFMLERAYERKKDYYVNRWYDEIENDINFMSDYLKDEKKADSSVSKIEQEIINDPFRFFDTAKNVFKPDLIRGFYPDLKGTQAKSLAAKLNKKLEMKEIEVCI